MNSQKTIKSLRRIITRIFISAVLFFITLFIILVLLVRTPWAQNKLIQKAQSYVSERTNTRVEVNSFFLTFRGDLDITGLLLEDQKKDTLLQFEHLRLSVPIMNILRKNEISVNLLTINGLKSDIKRSINGETNYDFLIEAFASSPKESPEQDLDSYSFSVKRVQLQNTVLRYSDEKENVEVSLRLANLKLNMERIDLQKSDFKIHDIFVDGSDVKFIQKGEPKDLEEKQIFTDNNIKNLANIEIRKLNVLNFKSHIELNDQFYLVDLAKVQLKRARLDLRNKDIIWRTIQIKNSYIDWDFTKANNSVDLNKSKEDTSMFTWPDWNVKFHRLDLNQIHINQRIRVLKTIQNHTTNKITSIADLNVKLEDFDYRSNYMELLANLKNLHFKNLLGVDLSSLRFKLKLSDRQLNISNFDLKTSGSSIEMNTGIQFNSLTQFIRDPEQFSHCSSKGNILIDISEFKGLLQDFDEKKSINTLSKHPISIDYSIKGNLKSLELEKLNTGWNESEFHTYGSIEHLSNHANRKINFEDFVVQTTKNDLLYWIEEVSSTEFDIPEKLALRGKIKTEEGIWESHSTFSSTFGNAHILVTGKISEDPEFDMFIEFKGIQIDKILKNKNFSPLYMDLKAKGKYAGTQNIDLDLDARISQFTAYSQSLDNLILSTKVESNEGIVELIFANQDTDIEFRSGISIMDSLLRLSPVLQVNHIDLCQLGITEEDITSKFTLESEFLGNKNSFEIKANLKEMITEHQEQTYRLENLLLNTKVEPESTDLTINSSFFNTTFRANDHLQNIFYKTPKLVSRYLSNLELVSDSLERYPLEAEWVLEIVDIPLRHGVIMSDLKEMDTLKLQVKATGDKEEITANLDLAGMIYRDIELSDFAVHAMMSPDKSNFNISFSKISNDQFSIPSTSLDLWYDLGAWSIDFNARKGERDFFFVRSYLQKDKDNWFFHLDDERLVLNYQDWNVHPENAIFIYNDSLHIYDFQLGRNQQKISIQNTFPVDLPHIGILFEEFELGTFTSYLFPDVGKVDGDVNGQFLLINPFDKKGLTANLAVQNIVFLNRKFGNLNLNAASNGSESYSTEIIWKGEDMDVILNGKYYYLNKEPIIDISADLHKVEMRFLQQFASEWISDASGIINANAKISGPLSQLAYHGAFHLKDVSMKINELESKYSFGDEKISFNEKEIEFKHFTIIDENENVFRSNGKIKIDKPANPGFDLNFVAKDFMLINSSPNPTADFYGKVFFDLDAQLGGDLNSPDLNMSLRLNRNTEFTYYLPHSQIDLIEREGVVLFVNKAEETSNDLQDEDKEFEILKSLRGFEVAIHLSMNPMARFSVYLDKVTGDHAMFQGQADLMMNMSRNGKVDLSGQYEVGSGYFDMNLYNLVSRRFDIGPGSTINWYGDPLDADLNIRAIYQVETTPTPLMAQQLASQDAATQNRFRRQLPFLVFLNVKGSINTPELSFQLDMPENRRAVLEGKVYDRILQVNQREDELNKQVFSLLVLNRFFPETGSDGSQGGMAAMVRNNINQALSDQLNVFSNKLMGSTGIQLNFDFQSYTDLESGAAQDRTDLDISAQTSLFNERLVVEAGGQVNVQGDVRPGESNLALGNVRVEYLITEDGRWRAKGFRKNEFENVIDGQVIISGLSLIFNKEFNDFLELRKSMFSKSPKPETPQKKKREENDVPYKPKALTEDDEK
jgi:translocation and assembly module TamB